MAIQSEWRYYLKLKALHYLYEMNYSQTEISKMLSISRVTLKKLLDEAKEEGMIKFEIFDTRNIKPIVELEDRVKETFHLKDVKIVDCSQDRLDMLTYKLAQEAGKYLEFLLSSNMKLGVTWGYTLNLLFEMISEDASIHGLDVYTLVGGSGSNCNFQPNVLVQKISDKFKGTKGHIINGPFRCRTQDLCTAIKQEPQISAILENIPSLDMILVGIGDTPSMDESFKKYYGFGDEITQELIEKNAVGDICANFYDMHGNPCRTSLDGKVVSVDIQVLAKHKNVIGVGGGTKKARAILGALNGKYLDVLITDMQTAKDVLMLADTTQE